MLRALQLRPSHRPPPPQFDGFVIDDGRIIRFADSPCARRQYVLILFFEKVFPTPVQTCRSQILLLPQVFLHSMAESDKENRSLSKTATSKGYTAKVFHDPEHNSRNSWLMFRLFALACLCLSVALLSDFLGRCQRTFGRWSREKGMAVFVTGIPAGSDAFKQPVFDLYSWKAFVDSGKEVRVAV